MSSGVFAETEIPAAHVMVGVTPDQKDLVSYFLKNYFRFCRLPLTVVSFDRALEKIRGPYPVFSVIEFLDGPVAGWLRKPLAIGRSCCETTIWLDLDIEVRGDIAKYLGLLKNAHIAAGIDHKNPLAFRRNLPAEAPLWDSGVVVVRNDSPVLKRWIELVRRTDRYNFRGDHEALSLAIHESRDENIVRIPRHYHLMRLDPGMKMDGSEGLLTIHWTGAEGKRVIRDRMHGIESVGDIANFGLFSPNCKENTDSESKRSD